MMNNKLKLKTVISKLLIEIESQSRHKVTVSCIKKLPIETRDNNDMFLLQLAKCCHTIALQLHSIGLIEMKLIGKSNGMIDESDLELLEPITSKIEDLKHLARHYEDINEYGFKTYTEALNSYINELRVLGKKDVTIKTESGELAKQKFISVK